MPGRRVTFCRAKLVLTIRRVFIFLDRWHWVWLTVASPLLLFPSPARSPALLVVPLIWLVGWFVRPAAPLASTPLNGAVLLLAALVLVSVVVTPDLAYSLPKVAGMVLGFGAFFAVAREARRPAGLWLCTALFVAIGLGIALFAVVGTNWLDKFNFLSGLTARLGARVVGLPGSEEGLHPNTVAGTLLWVAPVCACMLWGVITVARRNRRGLLIAVPLAFATVLIFGLLVLTQSRSAYIGAAVTVFFVVILLLPRRWRGWAIGATVIIAVGLLVVLEQGGGVTPVLQRVLGSASSSQGLSTVTFEGRLEVWSRALYGIQDFPFTGMGMGMFRRVVHVLYPLFTVSPDYDIGHAHNELLQAALDLGIPGLIAFGALYLIAAWMLSRIWVSPRSDRLTRALAFGLGSGLFAHAVFGLTDTIALGAKPGVLFWVLLGLVCGLYEICVAAPSNGHEKDDPLPPLMAASGK